MLGDPVLDAFNLSHGSRRLDLPEFERSVSAAARWASSAVRRS